MIVLSIYIYIIFNIYTIKTDDCQYSTPNGMIDLRTLGYKNRPKYTNVPDTSSKLRTFSFNGCFPYSTTDSCKNAAACATDLLTSDDSLIALQTNRKFDYNQEAAIIQYTDGAGIQLNVYLICKDIESIQAAQLNSTLYIMNIESVCGCPGKCTYKPENSLTGGAIFIIILVSSIVTYLIVSVVFLRFVKHEQGINLVPNRQLWLQIMQDWFGGIRFLLSKIRRKNTYDQV